jgi:hypothetical protein
MASKYEKAMTVAVCAAGIIGVAYGMADENHSAFVLGLLFVIAGYLRIRRKLKETPKGNDSRGDDAAPGS